MKILLRTLAACASIVFLDLALWAAGQHQLLSPFALALAGLIPLAIGVVFVIDFELEIPLLAAGVGTSVAIAYASLGGQANAFIFPLVAVPICAVWIATRTKTPWTSMVLLATSGGVLGLWGIEWRIEFAYALASGASFVLAALAIATICRRNQYAQPALVITVGTLLFVALGAHMFDASTAVLFASLISISLAFGLLASRPALGIAIVLGILGSLILYTGFEILVALACTFIAGLFLARFAKSEAITWVARLPLGAGIAVLVLFHPAFEVGAGAAKTHLWCVFTIVVGAQAFLLARFENKHRTLALAISGAAGVVAAFTEITHFAGFGLGLTVIAALVGLLATSKSKPVGLAILALTTLKFFVIDWQSLNGTPRVAILIAAAVTMLLFAVRVKTTADGERESSGGR